MFRGNGGKFFSVDPARLPMGMLMDYIELARSSTAASFFRLSARMFAAERPQALLRMVEYRGVTSATMIYDSLPINDTFRCVAPGVLIGAMDMRGLDEPFMFTLRRETAFPEE